ncbi:hypothetical protein ABL78_2957 [Leptomonas seymouri]|uniref:YEATS domain-containing protein n=1 Tax=Leptomonas seymouri TaxID=5684 RepID=A0A0N0P6S1_LEPSE|nr:hypothetical protein ABL78_2957 [Leptomonas seymouri]|eukprot:KPI87966.1 hypothetical protein ABL78_2957 [Leptomonas seymouri]
MASVESQRVVYSASFDIPYAIGSVAIPISKAYSSSADGIDHAGTEGEGKSSSGRPGMQSSEQAQRAGRSDPTKRRGVTSGNINSVRRCTHHRYCYLRDGGALEQDAFYRWLQHLRSEITTETKGSTVGNSADDCSPKASPVSASSDAAEPQSPSPLYASLACVVFLLPSSFPHPRRVLRRPPYLIEDDTWAEHMVEVQMHFLSHLRIPPVTLVHQALLERRTPPLLRAVTAATDGAAAALVKREGEPEREEVREIWVPQLLASSFGKPKLPPVPSNVVVQHFSNLASGSIHVIDTSTTAAAAEPPAHSSTKPPSHHHHHHYGNGGTVAGTTVVVTEKVDTLRLYHPSLGVLQHLRCILALSSRPALRELQDAYEQLYQRKPTVELSNRDEDRSLDTPFLYAWSLPYEDVVAEYAAQRASTSVAVLQAVLSGLKRERAAMEKSCQRLIDQMAELATKAIPEQLKEVHNRCLKLYRKE